MKKWFKYFKFSYLRDQLNAVGYNLTFKNLIIMLGSFSFILFVIGYLMYLKLVYILIFVFVFLVLFPFILIFRHKADYERYRFSCIVEYMEQMLYAFNKNNKIRNALVDVYDVTAGYVHEIVHEMIEIIDTDNTTDDVYRKAFAFIEGKYDCQRLRIMHDYMIEVERSGGDCTHSLTILLQDLRSWSSRTLAYQNERKAIQGKVTISIGLAMLAAGLMLNLVPSEYLNNMIEMNGYQLGTLMVLLMCIFIYYLAASRVCRSYLDNELDRDSATRYKKYVAYVAKYDSVDHKVPRVIKTALVLAGVGSLIFFKIYYAVPFVAGLGLYIVFGDMLRKGSYVKRVTKEIIKCFPSWLRSLILFLQTENVQVAIQKSYFVCPEILKPEVYKLIVGLDKYPNSSKPYSEFLRSYDVPSLKLAVSYLYSISQFGSEDMVSQLDYLIEQSNELSMMEEKLRNEDSLAGFSTLGLAPMLCASLKLALDMTLFLNIVMGMMDSAASIK